MPQDKVASHYKSGAIGIFHSDNEANSGNDSGNITTPPDTYNLAKVGVTGFPLGKVLKSEDGSGLYYYMFRTDRLHVDVYRLSMG